MKKEDINLLKDLCKVHAPSGSESKMKSFLLSHIEKVMAQWKIKPDIIAGDDFQDCLILVFGKPRTAVFAHMDNVGYTVGYNNQLIKIGGPKAKEGTELYGNDSKGEVNGTLNYSIKEESDDVKQLTITLDSNRTIDRGTPLSYKPKFKEDGDYIESNYLDNRLGILNALKLAETLENGAIVFSAWEEVGGGSVGFLAKYLYEKLQIKQALISDITWVTEGVKHGKGVAISMRDSGIPRRSYIEKIISIAERSKIDFQLEVESAGGSDGNAIQRSPYPIDWCFIGAPEDNVHMPNERVYKYDFKCMTLLYSELMREL